MDESRDWYMDDEFDTPLPGGLSEEVRRFYGKGHVGSDFAQMLAAFLACGQSRAVTVAAVCTPSDPVGEETGQR